MIAVAAGIRVLVATKPVDFRQGADGLVALVRDTLGHDPFAGTYAPGRGAVHALKLLDHYRGVVQCDGYAAYKTIADKACGEAITLGLRVMESIKKFITQSCES